MSGGRLTPTFFVAYSEFSGQALSAVRKTHAKLCHFAAVRGVNPVSPIDAGCRPCTVKPGKHVE